MAVGPMTIPIIKKDGFSNEYCGAISAILGTGGHQLVLILTIIALCGSIEGVGKGKFSMTERVLLFAAAVCELHSSIIIKIVSNTVIAVILLKNYLQNSRHVCKF